MDGSEEGSAVFGIARSDAAPSFELQERVFNQVAQFVEILIIGSLHGSVFARGDHRRHALLSRLFDNCIAVIPLVRDQIIGIEPFNQAASLCAISCGTLCNKDSDRHTMRIHGQMYLGVEPPFVRPIS